MASEKPVGQSRMEVCEIQTTQPCAEDFPRQELSLVCGPCRLRTT